MEPLIVVPQQLMTYVPGTTPEKPQTVMERLELEVRRPNLFCSTQQQMKMLRDQPNFI